MPVLYLRAQISEAHVAGCERQLVTVSDKMRKFTEPRFADLKWRRCHLPHGWSVKHCRFLSDVESPWIVCGACHVWGGPALEKLHPDQARGAEPWCIEQPGSHLWQAGL